jgi:hypothetical protein
LDFTKLYSHQRVLHELHEVFANGLRQRISTYNVPVWKVRIDHCVILAKRANGLKKLVTDFRWDGEEGIDADDEPDSDEDYDSDPTQAEWGWWNNYSDRW